MTTRPTPTATGRWAAVLAAAIAATAPADELKTTRVALFSSGVGYFEAAATVEGTASAELKFRVEQINDVLKSLVLRDLDGGTVAAVQYPTRDPVEKTLKSFAVDITGRPTLGELLGQLRGAAVEVRGPNAVAGSVVGVERQKFVADTRQTVERDVLTLLTAEGLRTFVLAEVAGVKLLDPRLEGELRQALETLAASHDSEKKTVVLNFAGAGRRRVLAGYILETPVWKTGYRLVLAADRPPYLQGWAIVENATEQDWTDVRLSLVSGRPISFTMDLYQPLYLSRPVEQPARYEALRAPVYARAREDAKEKAAAPPAAAAPADAPARRSRAEGKDAMFDRADHVVLYGGLGGRGGEWELAQADAAAAGLPAESGVNAAAVAREAGELFEYAIAAPVTLRRQQSAMLPIVTEEISGQKVSIFNPAVHPRHPLNGLRLRNTTGLHLTAGPVTVYEDGVYAGDAKLPDLRKDEERLVAYALDLAVEVEVRQAAAPETVTRRWIADGVLHQRRQLVDEREYHLKNKNPAPRTVLIEQAAGDDWQLVEPPAADERAAGLLRFQTPLKENESRTLKVRLERPLEETVALVRAADDDLGFFLQQTTLSEGMRQALNRLVELRGAVAETQRQIAAAEQEIAAITEEQKRIRENMGVLAQTSDVYRRYEQKFNTQETRIETLREKVTELKTQGQAREAAVRDYLKTLTAE